MHRCTKVHKLNELVLATESIKMTKFVIDFLVIFVVWFILITVTRY